jgi:hypothetical protein
MSRSIGDHGGIPRELLAKAGFDTGETAIVTETGYRALSRIDHPILRID